MESILYIILCMCPSQLGMSLIETGCIGDGLGERPIAHAHS